MLEGITVALIAATASIIVALLQRARRQNSEEHELVMALMRVLGRKIDKVNDKLDSHVQWHLDEASREHDPQK